MVNCHLIDWLNQNLQGTWLNVLSSDLSAICTIVEICILIRLEDDPAPIYTEASVIRVPACMTANNINIWPTAFYIYCMVNKKDEESQINGILMIMDLKSVGWKHVKNISPLYSKRIMSLLQVRSSLGIEWSLWLSDTESGNLLKIEACNNPKYRHSSIIYFLPLLKAQLNHWAPLITKLSYICLSVRLPVCSYI